MRTPNEIVKGPAGVSGASNRELGRSPDWCQRPDRPEDAGSFEVVVPYTSPEITALVVEQAAVLAAGLNVTLKLVAVYVAPYPADLRCPAAMQEHLTARLAELAGRTHLPSTAHLVVSRDRNEGLRQVLRPASPVLLGSRKRWWPTREERLARDLTRQGHRVSLLHFD
ncbi:MAG: hypothetical protein LAP40_01825 [Acidobacteriia bacterium]|nr:hypothetical protein [Terriglobia bacterium]